MAGYFEEPPEPTPQIDYREMMEAFDAAMKTAEREEAARRKQAKIYDAARKDIQKTLDDAKKVLGDVEFTRAMSQERMTPSELYRWSKQMERKHKALEKRCREKGIDYLEQDTEDAARRAKENAARRNITRAKAMLASIDAATSQMAADTQINFSKTLKTEGLKSAKQEEKTLEIGFDIDLDSISPAKVKALVDEDFYGGNYTNKIRRSRDKLNRELERCIRLGQVNGWSIDRLSKEMVKRVGINEREANRLLRTEMTRVSNEAALEQLKSCGARFYKYIAAMDSRTCERCKAIHGHVFAIDKAKAGENFPPLHPNCRCRIVINAENETGEYDTSYVDDIVDENIRKALDKWASEGIDVLPDMLSSPDNNASYTDNMLVLPEEAYKTKEETRFNDLVLSKYKANGVSYNDLKAAYIQSMADRGIPAGAYSLMEHIYTRSVWDEIPPIYVRFSSTTDAKYSAKNHELIMDCNSGVSSMYVFTHEATHALDCKILRPRGVRNRTNHVNIAFKQDSRDLLRDGFVLNNRHYDVDLIRELAGKLHEYDDKMDKFKKGIILERPLKPELFNVLIVDVAAFLNTRNTLFAEIVANHIVDSLQSALGYDYGAGHEESYCIVHSDEYVEAIANIGVSYLWGFGRLFSLLFPRGYNKVQQMFVSNRISPLRQYE